MSNRTILFTIFSSVLMILDCMNMAGPGTSVSGNGYITGRVVDLLGHPVSHTRVILLPDQYNPLADPAIPDSMRSITDETGRYCVKAPSPGMYSVEAADSSTKCKSLVTGIRIDNKDTVPISESVLRRPGVLRIVLSDTVNEGNGYVYLPGTTCYGDVVKGIAMIEAVPAGSISTINYVNETTPNKNHIVKTNIIIPSNETLVISDVASWKYSKKLYLNTTPEGAGIAGNVYNFPVLVRLTSTNFDFSQAKGDGADFRITKSNGAPLYYEIERWDAVMQAAEIWVKLDTVYGNNNTQSLIMYWGNTNAAAQSNSATVFDTASGFQGVWHLSEAGSAIEKDATGNHYDGTPSDTAPTSETGEIGHCRVFNGSSNFIRMNGTANSKLNFPENGAYTVSAWVYVDSFDNVSHMIAGKSNEQYYLKFKPLNMIPNSPMVWEFVEYYNMKGYNISNSLPSVPSVKTWSYLVGVRNGTQQYLYLNGEPTDSTSFTSWAAPGNTGDDVTIGKFITAAAYNGEGKCPFLGKIDEVRISSMVYNTDWVKLSFMNQKKPDALIKW